MWQKKQFICSDSESRNYRNVSPSECSNCIQASSVSDFFDPSFRPMMKQMDVWGSRPIPGRDWGASCRCDDYIIQEMLYQLERDCDSAGEFAVVSCVVLAL